MNIILYLNILLITSAVFATIGLGLAFKRLAGLVQSRSAEELETKVVGHAPAESPKKAWLDETDVVEHAPHASALPKVFIDPSEAYNRNRLPPRVLRERLQVLTPFAAAVAVVAVVVGGLFLADAVTSQNQVASNLPSTEVCQTRYAAIFFIDSQSGSPTTARVVAACNFASTRIYLVIEKVINVSSNTNPHPVWFVKATLPQLQAGQAQTVKFVLNEPVGTEADFYVISVDHNGLIAMGRHQVADHGILHLPSGTRQESATEVHVKS